MPAEHISKDLLLLFAQLANPANPSASDSDIAYYCAFNFPGVVQAVGASRWGELSEAFGTLATQIQWKVRRTLAYSLHDIASILGRELAETELVPLFDVFLKDLDEIKVRGQEAVQGVPRLTRRLCPLRLLVFGTLLSVPRLRSA